MDSEHRNKRQMVNYLHVMTRNKRIYHQSRGLNEYCWVFSPFVSSSMASISVSCHATARKGRSADAYTLIHFHPHFHDQFPRGPVEWRIKARRVRPRWAQGVIRWRNKREMGVCLGDVTNCLRGWWWWSVSSVQLSAHRVNNNSTQFVQFSDTFSNSCGVDEGDMSL